MKLKYYTFYTPDCNIFNEYAQFELVFAAAAALLQRS